MAAHTPSETMPLEDAPSASASSTTPWATPGTQDTEHTPRDQSEQPDADQPSPPADGAADSHAPRPQVPMQKRRRVTRACDECRRKKIKCDGKQPCTHCTVYSYGASPMALAPNPPSPADAPKSAPTTSPPTAAAMPPRSTSRRWRTG